MDFSNTQISVYVANLKRRKDRLLHIKKEFKGKNEFDVQYIEAFEEKIGTLGLWKTLQYCIRQAREKNDEVIIFCEDDHKFTKHYNKEFMLDNIVKGNEWNAELIIGGSTGGFNVTVPLTENLIWVDHYNSNNFLIIYKRFFNTILSKNDFNPLLKVDNTLATLAIDKFLIYPFISIQKNFNYSDVTSYNNHFPGEVIQRFENNEKKIGIASKAFKHYQKLK